MDGQMNKQAQSNMPPKLFQSLGHKILTVLLPYGGCFCESPITVGITLSSPSIVFKVTQFLGNQIRIEKVYRRFGILTLLSSFSKISSLYKCKQDCNYDQ